MQLQKLPTPLPSTTTSKAILFLAAMAGQRSFETTWKEIAAFIAQA
jgi:hypothetical protein